MLISPSQIVSIHMPFVLLNPFLADNDVGIPTLLEKLQKEKIRDISRKERGLEYTLSE